MVEHTEEQKEEFEALASIFLEEFVDLATFPNSCMIQLNGLDVDASSVLRLKFTLPPNYPDDPPHVDLPLRSNEYLPKMKLDLLGHLQTAAEESIGSPSIYAIVEAAREWLSENLSKYQQHTNADDCTDVPSDIHEELAEETDAFDSFDEVTNLPEGKWDFVIGLVGKPSAGKSTFFNAATNGTKAKVGAHPFTTIEPNFSQAFYAIVDPPLPRGIVSEPAYGRPSERERYIPILLKDVAGLVPGASDGKGRGNRFLNDLCDADVLIHVVDVSGKTNECGEAVDAYDPANDVRWLSKEIHNWIYDNIMKKWDTIVKRPMRLLDMFTGYHCSPSLIRTVFARAKLSIKSLPETIPHWETDVLHCLVNNFVAVRFPMLLALNKSDSPEAAEIIERLGNEFPSLPQIAVSAKSECHLQELVSSGFIRYLSTSGDLEWTEKTNNADLRQTCSVMEANVIKRFGGTNVHAALSRAVALRHPTYVFPVRDLTTFMSHEPLVKGQRAGVMRDCILLKPGTTVEHLYILMVHHYHMVTGKYVRAEALGDDGQTRIVRKEDVLDDSNCVIKIMTTKKS